MLSSLKNIIASPLTKYMTIAILVLCAALGGTLYLSYKFYGEKQVAEQESQRLEDVAVEERRQTEKVAEGAKVVDEAVNRVRESEKDIERASQRAVERISNPTPTQPTGEDKNATESTTDAPDDCLTDDDVRLLQSAHCLSDGDTSDCNF